jgi:uncharacterized membrane protein YdbT with pleckstrin-like domain
MKTFELGHEEYIVAIFRKHPFYVWITIAKYILIAVLPVLAGTFIGNTLGDYSDYAFIIYLVFLIILWISFFIEYTDFMLDTWVLTNERLVDVEQLALFSRRISTLSLDRIQDITIEQSGLLNSMLGIGTVFIQTAGTEDEFKIIGMREPSHVKDIIMQTYQSSKDKVFEKIAELR